MTILGIVSDTHFPRFGRMLPAALVAGLQAANVDRIIHCGDMTDLIAVELFSALAPFDAVAGNNDGAEIAGRFGRKKIVTIEDVRIGLVHGDIGRHAAPRNALAAFAAESVDLICFGHSHRPLNERHGDRVLLNPGSPTDKRLMPAFSYAIVRVDAGAFEANVHTYADRRCA